MKRIISITLSFILVFTLCQLVLAEGGTVHNVNDQTTLTNALATAQTGDTIKLTADITYTSTIVIENKSVTFNLNGYTLNVVNNAEEDTAEEMSGLYVKGNAAVALEGDGEFNVTGSWYGVFAECNEGEGAEVTVTNATGIGRDGVAAQHSKVTVKGDATSSGSTYSGVWASYENAEVIVEGDVYANGEMSMGVNTDTLASVTVKGRVIVSGSGSMGIKASDDGEVTVNGNVSVSGSGSIGVSLLSVAGYPSIVTIKGVIEAEKYILFEAEDESEWEYSLRDGDFDEETTDYIYYTYDKESFVYVSTFAGGSGTAEDPYLIAHASQLYNIKYYHFFGKHYKQIADIDLGGYFSLGEGWDPIGNGESPFLGVYDGDSHTISNLFINRPDQGDIGLFGAIGHGAEIRNVGLIDADVIGHHYVGGLTAVNYGLIINSYVIGKVSGTTYAGGLIGYNMGSVTDSYFDGTVSHVKGYETDEVEYAGGMVGDNSEEGSITGCYAKATVESEGPLIGGLAGGNLGSITDSHAISDVTGSYYVGGLTGNNGGIINNSYADGTVTGASHAGGLVGLHESLHPVTDSYFTGTVTASDDYTGGLVGDNSGGTIEGCHANATVTSAGDYVGGLAGRSIGLITGSWSAGAVTGGSYVGGLVGASFVNAGSGEISEGITASYSDCAVEGEMYVGGLAGDNETPISESYATGDVTNAGEIDLTYTHFGGLVGKNTGPIGDSYAWGDVSGHQYVGGLIGYNEADVTNCYEIGAVSGNSNTGGLIGVNSSGANITGSFWNNNTSGQESSDGGISAGSVTMKQQVTYVNEDWNFDTIWDIDPVQPHAFNDGYPFLRWQVDAEFAGGSGTMEDPYLIATEDHLNNVRNHLDKHFRQTADLDLSSYRSGSGWAPIGTSANTFTGTYDGDGHTIGNLFIKQAGAWNVRIPAGLFGYTGAEAEISNLTLESVDVTGCYYVGSLVGNNSGGITNVSVSGTVTGEWDTGGLVGLNKGTISLTTFTGAVTGADEIEYGDWTGGLVGYNYGMITRCWVDATVVSKGDNAGGLVGESLTGGIITESCSAGTVTAGDYIGGLVGANSGEITACLSICTVNGDSDVGGLVGGNSGPIADSFAVGNVIGMNQTGGLVGSSTGATVTGCYWDKETSGQSTSAGGTGKTTAEMKLALTYVGWDFNDTWSIEDSKNDGYPFLIKDRYGITVANVTGGTATVTTDPATEAAAGATVTVSIANIEAGKQFKSITVADPDSAAVATTEITAGSSYTFTMPAKAVTVAVEVEIPALPNPTITSITAVSNVEVAYGTAQAAVLAALATTTTITDSNKGTRTVDLNWSIASYDGNTPGIYTATGTFALPTGVDQSVPETELKVTATVTVLGATNASINPSAVSFVKDSANSQDVSATITWGSAASVTAVKKREAALKATDDYTVVDNTLTIKKEYLAQQAVGDVVLTIEFNAGDAAALTITVSDSTIVTTANVSSAAELNTALGNTNITTINLIASFSASPTITRSLAINFGAYTLTGNVNFIHDGTGTSVLTGNNGNRIVGNLTVDTPNASLNNGVTVSATVTVVDVASTSWTESADGNTITITDPNGATITITGNPGSVTATEDAGGNLTITVNTGASVTNVTINAPNVSVEGADRIDYLNLTKDVKVDGNDKPAGKYYSIATNSTIANGATNPTVTVTGVNFAAGIGANDLQVDAGTTALTFSNVTRVSATEIAVEFTGTAEVGEIKIQAKTSAFNPEATEATNTLTIAIVPAAIDECFIATAAFGSKFSWPVEMLRHFRDQYLLSNAAGTAFVKFYYQNSPPIAAVIANNPTLKTMVRVLLAPLVASVFLLYHPAILLLVMILAIVLITLRFMRRRYILS